MDGQIKFCQLLTVSKIRMIGYWLLRVTTPESATESLWPLANQTAEVSPVQLNQSVAQGRTPRWQIYWYNPKTGPSPDWQMTSDFITIFNVNSSGIPLLNRSGVCTETWQWLYEVLSTVSWSHQDVCLYLENIFNLVKLRQPMCSVNKQHTYIQISHTHIFKSNTTVWGILFVRQYALVPSPN